MASTRFDATSLRQRFKTDGFVSIEEFLGAAELHSLRSDVSRILHHALETLPAQDVYEERPGDRSSLKQIQRLHEHDARIRTWAEGPFARLASLLLEDDAALQNVQYFDKAPGANTPTPRHQDGAYFPIDPMNAVTLWFALDDVGTEEGCLHYIRGSHRHPRLPHQKSDTLGFSRQIAHPLSDDSDDVAMPCRAGHLLAHHAWTVHHAAGNSSRHRHRRALGFIYYGASVRIDHEADARYQAALATALAAEGRLRPSS